jgi:hypothetical protein
MERKYIFWTSEYSDLGVYATPKEDFTSFNQLRVQTVTKSNTRSGVLKRKEKFSGLKSKKDTRLQKISSN